MDETGDGYDHLRDEHTYLRDDYDRLIKQVQYLPPDDIAQIERAFERARAAHDTQRRKSGELYVTHPLRVAMLLAELRMDADTLSAALLHDILEDTPMTYSELVRGFGSDVARLVVGVTKLSQKVRRVKRKMRVARHATLTYDEIDALSLVSLFMDMAQDLRVIVIKLCDRLHNLVTIDALKPERRLAIAQETLDLFAPVAARLGIWLIKKQLEDLSLQVIAPEDFAEIQEILRARSQLLTRDLEDTLSLLRIKLAADGINAEVGSLPEHIYGLYRHIKMHGWQSARAYDGLRVSVVVDTIPQCYSALGSVHSLWQPIHGRIADFIASPQDGLYRSLHTVVIDQRGHPLEVRIRTQQMNHLADYGVIAYLQHAGDGTLAPQLHPQVVLLKELDKLPTDDPQDFLELFKSQITPKHIRVFTPKGEVQNLPAGATPIDFAYAVHTEIGHRCYKALVNRRFAPLYALLRDGDQVEIIKSDAPCPERAWLDLDLGYVGNPGTLRHIRRWFAHQPEDVLIEQGRALIEKEIHCWGGSVGWTGAEIKTLARKRGMTTRSLCLRVGRGEISVSDLAAFVLGEAANWTGDQPKSLTLEVSAADRPGLLRDACQIVADENVNLERASALSNDESSLAELHLTLAAKTIRQIVRITHRLETMPSVIQLRCVQLPGRTVPAEQAVLDLPI